MSSSRQPSLQHLHPNTFTVHNYTQENALTQELLLKASHIIHQATEPQRWTANGNQLNRGQQPESSAPQSYHYVYNRTPPLIPFSNPPVDLKPWGSPFTPEEIFNLDDLDEFTRLPVPDHSPPPGPSPSTSHPPLDQVPLDQERKRLEGSIKALIPHPHIYPAPYIEAGTPSCGPYPHSGISYLAPYGRDWLNEGLRVAWLIPIRGDTTWDGASPAEIHSRLDRDPTNDEAGLPTRISWSPASLSNFWNFVLDLRKTGTFGPVGLAFQTTRPRPRRDKPVVAIRRHGEGSTASILTVTKPQTDIVPSPLLSLDHVKIFHDANQYLYLRQALDEWKYEEGSIEYFPFKRTRLVLLDHRSRPILTA